MVPLSVSFVALIIYFSLLRMGARARGLGVPSRGVQLDMYTSSATVR